jgi:hypothetical protein
MADGEILEAVRGLHLAHPELGPKPLLSKLREQQPDLAAGNKEVHEALAALKAEEYKAVEHYRGASRRRRAVRCQFRRRASERVAGAGPRLLRLRQAAVRDGRRPREASGVPDLPRAEGADDVLVRRELPGEPWRLEAAPAGTQDGEAAAEKQ